jgi:hypothetical protein
MPSYNDAVKRDMYRDLAAKQHMAACVARSRRISACDAREDETAEDYCRRMLQALGLKVGSDPVEGLSMFLQGHDHGVQAAASGRGRDSILGGFSGIKGGTSAAKGLLGGTGMDSAGVKNIVDKYIDGEL